MDLRHTEESETRLAAGIRAAALIIVVGTLAAVGYPLSHSATMVSGVDDALAARVLSIPVYIPARFAVPEHEEPQAPTF